MSPAPIRDLALSLDPALTMELAALTPDPWQADLLRSGRSALLLCSRQAGKSTVAASLAVHEALYRAPALVLLTAPTLRQAQELFRKVWGFQRLVGVVDPDQQSSLRLERWCRKVGGKLENWRKLLIVKHSERRCAAAERSLRHGTSYSIGVPHSIFR